jgi:acyl carrier protein
MGKDKMTSIDPTTISAIRDALDSALPEIENPDWDAALTSDVGLDSVQIMNLVMEIEDNLDLSVPVDVLAEVKTLNELARRLDSIRGAIR